MHATTLESRLEKLSMFESFSRPRISNINPYLESLFRSAKNRPDCLRRPFSSKKAACEWLASFVDRYCHQQRHDDDAIEI